MNSSVHKHIHRYQSMKISAHKIICFHSKTNGPTRFVWRLDEVLAGERLAVWVAEVRGQAGVQVRTQHVHHHLQPGS